MRILMVGAAALAVCAAAHAAAIATPPEVTAGDWRLSQVGGRVACTLTLTHQTSPAGFEVKAPLACRQAFPPLKTVATWALNDKGGIVLSDAQSHPIITFPEQEGAPFEAKAPDGSTWRLEPLHEVKPVVTGGRMSGLYRLTAPGGATLCDLTLTSNFFGTHGAVSQATCSPAWSDRMWGTWALRGGELTLMGKDAKPILTLKAGDPGVFVVADPKADAATLARR